MSLESWLEADCDGFGKLKLTGSRSDEGACLCLSGGLSEGMFGRLVCLSKMVWSDLWSAEQMVWSGGLPDKNSSRRRRKAENCKERNNNWNGFILKRKTVEK